MKVFSGALIVAAMAISGFIIASDGSLKDAF